MHLIKKHLLVFVLFLLLATCTAGCTTYRVIQLVNSPKYQDFVDANPLAFVKISLFGVYVIENSDNEIEVYKVVKGFAASKADIRVGDRIVSVNKIDIKSRVQLFEIIFERLSPGDAIEVKLKRNENLLTKNVSPQTRYFFKDLYALTYEITKNSGPVNLAIIVNSLEDSRLSKADINRVKSTLISQWGNVYLTFLRPEKNFSLIERDKIDTVLIDLGTQQSGLVDTASQQKVGYMLGASHLLVIDGYAEYLLNSKTRYIESHKLIEVKTGKILANVPYRMNNEILEFFRTR